MRKGGALGEEESNASGEYELAKNWYVFGGGGTSLNPQKHRKRWTFQVKKGSQ